MSTSASIPDDVLIVIRGIGERTEEATFAMAQTLVPKGHVIKVTGTPFAKTLQNSFEAALDRNLLWTCCVDADILIHSSAIRYFRDVVQAVPKHLFGVQGYILDQFFGGMRLAGTRIYRTALLKPALRYISHVGSSKRPETFVRRAMQDEGYEWISQGTITGLHDFEQYYRDVYRTAFFHAQKHSQHILALQPYWERMAKRDPDFLVALRGARDGAHAQKILGLDARNFTNRTGRVLDELGLTEKRPFRRSPAAVADYVSNTLRTWEAPPEYDVFWRQTRAPSRIAQLLGPRALRFLGLSNLPEQ